MVVFSPAARHNLISLVSLIISAMPGGKPGQGTIPMPDRIRVSCASLCRIEHEGWFLLLLNADRRQRGLYVLSPIGGALSITAYDRLAPFAAILETPQNDDLRLTLPRAKLPHFREWFYSGQGRERSPFRELREELVDEASLLPALEPEDVTWEHLWTAEEEAFTKRGGQMGVFTHYFLEVFGVGFTNDAVMSALLAAPSESGARWVTREQIEDAAHINLTVDGAERSVRVNGRAILAPP
ncbi:MAG: hypothetical protein GX613_13195 [Chloroflexi bacterium]|nr:hypothetical protein [Chloroflexota bacterium]